MKKFIGNIWFKLLAYIVFGIGVLLCTCSITGISYGVREDWYQLRTVDFANSDICLRRTQHFLSLLEEELRSDGSVTGYYNQPNGFSYRVTDENGTELANTSDRSSRIVAERLVEVNGQKLYIYGYIDEPVDQFSDYLSANRLFNFLYAMRNWYPIIGGFSLVMLGACVVFLFMGAGRRSGSAEIHRTIFDRMPLEILLALALLALAVLNNTVLRTMGSNYTVLLIRSWIYISAQFLLGLGVFISLVVRFRFGQWWHNTILYRIYRSVFRLFRSTEEYLSRNRASRAILVVYVLLLAVNIVFTILAFEWGQPHPLLIILVVDMVVFLMILDWLRQMDRLHRAGQALADGKLNHTVNTRRMWPQLKRHGEHLNNANLGLSRAVEARIKSEHFRTELITNVGHDLKTPLTSIINYVDLLKKENLNNAQAEEYIEVLERQACRLKKLTTDLLEVSKMSSGTMPVEWESVNMQELLNQVTGEFHERLEAAGLTLVMNLPAQDLIAWADGRLFWRVLDNMFQNVCKYAAAGTRFYVNLIPGDEYHQLVLKNVSAAPLNMTEEELMERFIRGDQSRHSEGNGLGLSIARSLMELMKGQMGLIIDGDLFKVSLFLPRDKGNWERLPERVK